MLANYIAASNDTAILNRALPLAEACNRPALLLPAADPIHFLARVSMVVEQPLSRCYQPLYKENLHLVALCRFKQRSAARILLNWYVVQVLFYYTFMNPPPS